MPKIATDLYRAIKEGSFDMPFIVDGEAVDGLLHPRFHDRVISTQRVRKEPAVRM